MQGEVRPDLRGLAGLERVTRIARWLAYVESRANATVAASAAQPQTARHKACGYLFGSPGHQAECCEDER